MSLGLYILNERGEAVPCPDTLTWGAWMESGNRRVAEDVLDDVRISTVFLGLDHSHFGGPPLIYETMIFGGDHNGWMARYSTRGKALAGHREVVARLHQGLSPERTDDV